MRKYPMRKRNTPCKAMTVKDLPCKNNAIGISDYCEQHGGVKLVNLNYKHTKRLRGLEKEANQLLTEIRQERAEAKKKPS